MIEPKEIELDGRVFIISKFPAVAGREIVAKYPLSGLPKLGDYQVNEDIMLKLMCYVGIPKDGKTLMLVTRGLVDNHTGGWETLAKVEMAMLEYNCTFLAQGRVSTFLNELTSNLPRWISQILTGSLAQSSGADKLPSTN